MNKYQKPYFGKYTFLLLVAGFLAGCKKPPVTTNNKIKEQKKESPVSQPVVKPPVKVKTDVAEVSLDVKIGQMIMVGINERKELAANDSLRKELKDGKIGGIILFEKNVAKDKSKEMIKKLISDLQSETSIKLFVSVDEEGGKVHRLKEKYGFVPMPSASYLGSLKGTDSTFYYAKQLAEELDNLGFNVNFAPVVDVNLNKENAVIGKAGRSYSDDPEVVATQAMAFIRAHHTKNVATTLKHFPGHGSSSSDTHKGLVDVTKQWQFKELTPYKKIFDSGECDAIVSCHVINCRLDTNCIPATLSKAITTEMLRDVLGFKGVVFSDDMQMYAISKNYGFEKSIQMAINAGVDVLVFGNNVTITDRIKASEIHTVIKKLVSKGEISPQRIDEAYQRIMALKNKKY